VTIRDLRPGVEAYTPFVRGFTRADERRYITLIAGSLAHDVMLFSGPAAAPYKADADVGDVIAAVGVVVDISKTTEEKLIVDIFPQLF